MIRLLRAPLTHKGCQMALALWASFLGLVLLIGGIWWWRGEQRFRTWNWDWTWRDPIAQHPWEDVSVPTGVHIELEPPNALMDQPWTRFRVTGLNPDQTVGLRAQTQDDSGQVWAAAGLWQADDSGTVDVTRQAPMEGTYDRVDPMGLLWSMRPLSPQKAPVFIPATPAYSVEITAQVGDTTLAQTTVTRRLWSEQVTCTEIREGRLVGAACWPAGPGPFPAVLLVSGSEGGYHPERAGWWAGHGVAAFSLAYFGVEPLPQTLARIPVEYFLEGLDWLRRQPRVDTQRIFVFGPSRGSEAALLIGLYAPEPPAGIIAVMPSHVLWSGLDFSRGQPSPAWTYQGQALPFVSTGWSWELLRMAVHQPARLRPLFEEALARGVPPEAVIPVERLRSRLLLIGATDDQMWPSAEMAQAIVARMRDHGQANQVQLLVLEGAGHVLFNGYQPPTRLMPPFLFGGVSREANVYGGLQAWEAMWHFVQGSDQEN